MVDVARVFLSNASLEERVLDRRDQILENRVLVAPRGRVHQIRHLRLRDLVVDIERGLAPSGAGQHDHEHVVPRFMAPKASMETPAMALNSR